MRNFRGDRQTMLLGNHANESNRGSISVNDNVTVTFSLFAKFVPSLHSWSCGP